MGGMVLRRLAKVSTLPVWYNDRFADDPTTATNGPIPDWFDYGASFGAGTVTTAHYSGDITSNQLASPGNPPVNSSGTISANGYKDPLGTDDFDVRALTYGTQTGYNASLLGSMSKDQINYVGFSFQRGTNTPVLYKMVNGVATSITPTSASSVAIPVSTTTVNTWVRFRRTGNVYEGFVNNTRVLLWTDTGNTIQLGPGFRYCGLRTVSLRSSSGGAVTRGLLFDKFTMKDYLAPQTPAWSYIGTSITLTQDTWTAPTWIRNPAEGTTFLTGSTAIVADADGNIRVTAKLTMTAMAAGTVLSVRFAKNTSTVVQTMTGTAGVNGQIFVSDPIPMVRGDTIGVSVMSNSATTTNRQIVAGVDSTYFRVAAA